jgi:hypothetical protein
MALIYKDGTLSAVSILAKQNKKIVSKYSQLMLEDLYEYQLFTPEVNIYEDIQYEISRDDNGLFYCKLYLPNHIYYSYINKYLTTCTFIKVEKQGKLNIVHLLCNKVITFRDLAMFTYDSKIMFNSYETYNEIISKNKITYIIVKKQMQNIINKLIINKNKNII